MSTINKLWFSGNFCLQYGPGSSSVSQPAARGSSHKSLSSSSTLSSTRTKLPRERYSSNLLYSSSSSEEEDNVKNTVTPKPRLATTNHHQSLGSTRSNPFENFTVGKRSSADISGEHQSIRSEYRGEKSKKRLPISASVSIAGQWSHFNPLGQVEGNYDMPALIPENEEEQECGYGGRENDRDLPLIDNWLVDDMSNSRNKDQPPAKRRKHQSSSGASRKEVRSFLEGSTTYTSSATLSQGGGGRKRPLQQQKNRTAMQLLKKKSPSGSVAVSSNSRRCTNDEVQSSNKKRKTVLVEDSSSSDSDERFLDSVIITEDDNNMMDSDCTTSTLASTKSSHLHTRAPFNSANTASSSTASSSRGVGRYTCLMNTPQPRFSSTIAPTINTAPNIPSTAYNMAYSNMPPLFRVRVKIESKSYLIPCPRKGPNGLDTTIQWLISQASERHYVQQGLVGARPRLSLTTTDGAILCPTDLVSHVLGPDEELVGVVEGWVEETMEERYLAACKKERVGE
jgi:hypothetical protein